MLPTFAPGHCTGRVMPPYTLLSLPKPNHGITDAITLSRMGNLLKRCMKKTPSTEGFLPISMDKTSTLAAKLFSVREPVGRSKLGMKRGDNPPETDLEDRQHADELQSSLMLESAGTTKQYVTSYKHAHVCIFTKQGHFCIQCKRRAFLEESSLEVLTSPVPFPSIKKK